MKDSDKKTITYEYRGTEFTLSPKTDWKGNLTGYSIIGILKHGDVVEIPAICNGVPIGELRDYAADFWNIREVARDVYPGVKKLIIPEEITRIVIRNVTFLDLAELQIDKKNEIYETDGEMLYSHEKKAIKLILALRAGMHRDTVVVPRKVQSIAEAAFADTRCTEILFENPDIRADAYSFERSSWMKMQGEIVYVGKMLYRVKKEFGDKTLTVRKGTVRIHPSAFDSLIPRKMVTPVIPSPSLMSSGWRLQRCISLTVTRK